MTDMQPCPTRVRKHIQYIILGFVQPFARLRIKYFVSIGFFPFFLPFPFYIPEVVFHIFYSFLLILFYHRPVRFSYSFRQLGNLVLQEFYSAMFALTICPVGLQNDELCPSLPQDKLARDDDSNTVACFIKIL